ncbi:MAG: hypothetical protein C5B50_27950 [Verrucomicrobia bacterium]|nr:MAG: hypothetical protein C5B50_27950 [Verrucomicrobiota bacterium]
MKKQILCAAIVAAIAVGCSSSKEGMGGSKEKGQYSKGGAASTEQAAVLNNGPTTGVKIADLPQPVKDTLSQQVPSAQISSIDKEDMNGKTVYSFTFTDSNKFPTMRIADDGTQVQGSSK